MQCFHSLINLNSQKPNGIMFVFLMLIGVNTNAFAVNVAKQDLKQKFQKMNGISVMDGGGAKCLTSFLVCFYAKNVQFIFLSFMRHL